MLNKAFEKENKAFRGYIYAAVTVTGPLHDVYEKIYKEFADKEREHIYEIGEKITALGGQISTACLPINDIEDALPKGYDAVLLAQQNAETETLEMYMEIHTFASKIGDIPTVLLIEHILEEEQQHHDELERILMDIPGKKNVEIHDKLEVDAFYTRKVKLANLFGPPHITDANMEHWIKQWTKLNNEMRNMEDEFGLMDEEADAVPEYKRLARERKDIKQALDNFDDRWMRDYFGDDELGDEVEPALTMTDYK